MIFPYSFDHELHESPELYFFEERIWFIGVKDFVTVHYRNQILSVAEVDDVMGITWQHVHGFNLIATHFPLQHLAFRVVQVALLDEAVTLHYNELLKLGIVPMLSFSYAWLRDINAYLSCIQRMYQLSK